MMCIWFAVPSVDRFPEVSGAKIPGELIVRPGQILINSGRKCIVLKVLNTGDRPIQVLIRKTLFQFFSS